MTAGTAFHGTRVPLRTGFLAMFFVARHKQGISALQFQRDAGLGSYQTAWMLLHKVRSTLVCGAGPPSSAARSGTCGRTRPAWPVPSSVVLLGEKPRRIVHLPRDEPGHRRTERHRQRTSYPAPEPSTALLLASGLAALAVGRRRRAR